MQTKKQRMSCSNKMLVMDLYKRPFNFLLPDNADKHRTCCGAVFSILIILVILTYASYKLQDMLSFGDYKLQFSEQENYFRDIDALKSSDGFEVAAGIIDFATRAEEPPIEDPEIGEIKIYKKYWDALADDGLGKLWFEEVKTKPCTVNDFNDIEGNNKQSKFYPSTIKHEPMLLKYANKLKCMEEEVSVNGNYDTGIFTSLMIVFEKCDPEVRTCKSP